MDKLISSSSSYYAVIDDVSDVRLPAMSDYHSEDFMKNLEQFKGERVLIKFSIELDPDYDRRIAPRVEMIRSDKVS